MDKKFLYVAIIFICRYMQQAYFIFRTKLEANLILAKIDGILLHENFYHIILKNRYTPQYINLLCIFMLIVCFFKDRKKRENRGCKVRK